MGAAVDRSTESGEAPREPGARNGRPGRSGLQQIHVCLQRLAEQSQDGRQGVTSALGEHAGRDPAERSGVYVDVGRVETARIHITPSAERSPE